MKLNPSKKIHDEWRNTMVMTHLVQRYRMENLGDLLSSKSGPFAYVRSYSLIQTYSSISYLFKVAGGLLLLG